MKERHPVSVVCPKCGESFTSDPQRSMREMKRIGAARVRQLDRVILLVELKATRGFLNGARAEIQKLRKEDRVLLNRLQKLKASEGLRHGSTVINRLGPNLGPLSGRKTRH